MITVEGEILKLVPLAEEKFAKDMRKSGGAMQLHGRERGMDKSNSDGRVQI